MPLSQAISLFGMIATIISIWVRVEIRLAELNIEIANVKQDMVIHKEDNRRDFENLRNDIHSDTREILGRVDEIQIYLRKK